MEFQRVIHNLATEQQQQEFFYWKWFATKTLISGWVCPQVLGALVVSALQISKAVAGGSAFFFWELLTRCSKTSFSLCKDHGQDFGSYPLLFREIFEEGQG